MPPRRLAGGRPVGRRAWSGPIRNSAAVWHYAGRRRPADGKRDFKDTMHRTLGMAAVQDNLLVIADLAGLVHCLDARTGKAHWTYDMISAVWGSPLIVDGKIYLGDEDGDVAVFALSPTLKLLAKNAMGGGRLHHAGRRPTAPCTSPPAPTWSPCRKKK